MENENWWRVIKTFYVDYNVWLTLKNKTGHIILLCKLEISVKNQNYTISMNNLGE